MPNCQQCIYIITIARFSCLFTRIDILFYFDLFFFYFVIFTFICNVPYGHFLSKVLKIIFIVKCLQYIQIRTLEVVVYLEDQIIYIFLHTILKYTCSTLQPSVKKKTIFVFCFFMILFPCLTTDSDTVMLVIQNFQLLK